MKREETEWCQYYWFDTNKASLKRILLIGDSIVVGSRGAVANSLKEEATVAAFSTSKIIGDVAFYKELDLALGDYKIDGIYFNNGLHGLDYDEEFYARELRKFVEYLLLKGHKNLCWRSSTPATVVNEPNKLDIINDKVVARNLIAEKIMNEYQIPIDDIYTFMLKKVELRCGDKFHYTAEGYQVLGKQSAQTIKKLWL